MKKIYIFATAVAIMSTVFLVVKYGGNRDGDLVGSRFVSQTTNRQPSPIPIPTPSTPKTFKFDASNDLKMELEKVNPQVLDSDFE